MLKERRSISQALLVWSMRAGILIVALWMSFVVFFVNPINWKLYSQLSTWDWVWAWLSNIGTLALALTLWWWVQRLITRKIDAKKGTQLRGF